MQKSIVIGIGGAGCNILRYLKENKLEDIDYCCIESDKFNENILLDSTHFIGELEQEIQGNPQLAEQFAKSAEKTLTEILFNSDNIFLLVGLGGGIGTGMSPVVAEIAHKLGKRVVSFVVMPFEFEGRIRNSYARQSVDKLNLYCEKVWIFNNDEYAKYGSISLFFEQLNATIKHQIQQYLA
ncbi:protein FtsZ [Pasteurella multocida]|nr:protein FtsZ [Pasteurella multocida]